MTEAVSVQVDFVTVNGQKKSICFAQQNRSRIYNL